MYSKEELNDLLIESVNEVRAAGLQVYDIKADVKVDNAKRRFGLCKCLDKKNHLFEISLSKRCLSTNKQIIKETMVHEVLHCIHNAYGHGFVWKNAANMMNKLYGYSISRLIQPPEEFSIACLEAPTYKYKITCNECGAVLYRTRRSNLTENPSSYRCVKCRGKFTVEKC